MKEFRISELRAADPAGDNSLILEGIPIVFDKPTTINSAFGSYTEIIKREALADTLLDDTRLLYNHDMNRVPLARTPKTMQLTKEKTGVRMVATLPNTETAREVHTAVTRKDLTGMSFTFKVPKGGSSYDAKTNTRTITKIEKIYEVSIVPFPAYDQTSVEARAVIEGSRAKEPARKEAMIKINKILMKEVF